jgi:hypothetical protein
MAFDYKILGQSAPSATTATTVYTVPSGRSAVISSIIVCNRSATATTYRVALRPAGATLADQHYVAYDVPVGGNDTTTISIGITLAATDVVTVYTAAATVSFTVSGSEIYS